MSLLRTQQSLLLRMLVAIAFLRQLSALEADDMSSTRCHSRHRSPPRPAHRSPRPRGLYTPPRYLVRLLDVQSLLPVIPPVIRLPSFPALPTAPDRIRLVVLRSSRHHPPRPRPPPQPSFNGPPPSRSTSSNVPQPHPHMHPCRDPIVLTGTTSTRNLLPC
ncbi:hypothetical protein C8R46DRAFT_1114377 [Mycena filopes]|nr:hypothetical protein C8R46DRAFT_1114377 [Mycena filopes]